MLYLRYMLTKKEEKILQSINIRSDNDPNNPEFPASDPKFPATSTFKIKVPGFNNIWFKDESENPTGTHKDRMAWEMIVTYRDFLIAKKLGQIKKLPQLSIITSGTAGYTIQKKLRKYNLPNLKCLIDTKLDPAIKKKLKNVGCEIFETNLAIKPYSWKDILNLTDNKDGFDITSSEAFDPTTRYYDWLSYEIINSSPDYCFIPFGTGNLFENVLNVAKREISSVSNHDPRFKGNIKKLRQCNYLGATVNNPKSKADKLYSPHLPFVHFDEQWIRFYRYAAYCGKDSEVHILKEKYLNQAMELGNKLKLNFEPSGISGLGMLLQLKNKIPKNKKILIVSTGKTKYN